MAEKGRGQERVGKTLAAEPVALDEGERFGQRLGVRRNALDVGPPEVEPGERDRLGHADRRLETPRVGDHVQELVENRGGHDEGDVATSELSGEVVANDAVLRERGHVRVHEDVRVEPALHEATSGLSKISS